MTDSKGNHNLENSGSISIDSWDNQLHQHYYLFSNTCILLVCLVAFYAACAIPTRAGKGKPQVCLSSGLLRASDITSM